MFTPGHHHEISHGQATKATKADDLNLVDLVGILTGSSAGFGIKPWPMTDPAGAGILMLTWLGYIDGIHGTPYIAAPWITIIDTLWLWLT